MQPIQMSRSMQKQSKKKDKQKMTGETPPVEMENTHDLFITGFDIFLAMIYEVALFQSFQET